MNTRKMQSDHSNELEELKRKHKEEIANLKSDLTKQKEEEIKQIKERHASDTQALKNQHEQAT